MLHKENIQLWQRLADKSTMSQTIFKKKFDKELEGEQTRFYSYTPKKLFAKLLVKIFVRHTAQNGKK